MNGNINRNSLDHQPAGNRVLNNKSFQERGIRRYKNRNTLMNDNVDFRNSRNYKMKKGYKAFDDYLPLEPETMKIDQERCNNIHESFSHKTFNGDNISKNTYSSNRKSFQNSTINEYPRTIFDETKRNLKPKETPDDRFNQCDYKLERSQSTTSKSTYSCRKERTNVKLKLNFLQESQLNNEKCETSDNIKPIIVPINNVPDTHKVTNNGLNPAALEFTPSSTKTPTPIDSSKTTEQLTDAIDNEFKCMSLTTDNTFPTETISTDYGYVNQQQHTFAVFGDQSYLGKSNLNDSSLIHNPYQCQPTRQLSRLNYQQHMLAPQFQVALYGPNPQLIRYNTAQPVAGNYFVYNPIMINGLYNQYSGPVANAATTPMLSANRLVQLGAADIPVGNMSSTHNIAHQFNSNLNLGPYPAYFTDSSNNGLSSHIR